jgi:hypothetical protein
MSTPTDSLGTDEPPPFAAATPAEKMSRWCLLLLGASPIGLIPVALALRALNHYFP